MNKIEISSGTKTFAAIKNVADHGGKTSQFLIALDRKNAFFHVSDISRNYIGLEWERIPAFIAYCESKGITVERRR